MVTPFRQAVSKPQATPIGEAGRGALAGLVGSLVFSVLARALPGMHVARGGAGQAGQAARPADPDDLEQVRRWQERAQSPAAFRPPNQALPAGGPGGPPGATPAGALTQPQAPGPEGLAEQFAFKVGSGLFDRDVSPYARPAGVGVHLAYGSAWGTLYGLLQASRGRRSGPFGALYGLAVWLVGPALLVPAMKLMGSPAEEPPARTAMLVAGHVAYGVAVAAAFDALEPEARR